MISIVEQKFLSLALEEAKKSNLLMRHGCIAVISGKIASRGFNNYRTHSKDNFLVNTCSCHAEIDTLRKLYNKYSNTYGKYTDNIKVSNQ